MAKPDGWTWAAEPDDLWDYAATRQDVPTGEDEVLYASPGVLEFNRKWKETIEKISPETRQALTELWFAWRKQYPSRTGGVGIFVTEHLWAVFNCKFNPEWDQDPHEFLEGLPTGYVDALCNALPDSP